MNYMRPNYFIDCLVIRANDTPAQKAVKDLNLIRQPGAGVRLHLHSYPFSVGLTRSSRRSKVGT
jgi:hypothetical protein